MSTPLRSSLALLVATLLAPSVLATAVAAERSATCVPPASITAVEVVDDFALDVAADGRHYRLALDAACEGVQPDEALRLASTSGAICADGSSAAITAKAICGVTRIHETDSPADRCFRIDDVRAMHVDREQRVVVQLRGGDRRTLRIPSTCSQIDRLNDFKFVSGARDGRICAHPRDAVIGIPSAALRAGAPRQLNRLDFLPCPIVGIEPVETAAGAATSGAG